MPEEKTVYVSVEGAGTPQAVASGNPRTEESYIGSSFTTCHGRVIAVVRSSGERGAVRVSFSAPGLESKEVILEAG